MEILTEAVLPRLLVVPSFNSTITPADQLTIEYLHLIFNADTLIFGKDAKLVFREAENILLEASGRRPEGMAQQWWQYTVKIAGPLHVTWFTSCPNWFVWDSMSRKQQLLLHCRLSGTVFLVQADWILKLLLQSGKWYRCIRCCSIRLRCSFFPQAVRLTSHPRHSAAQMIYFLVWKERHYSSHFVDAEWQFCCDDAVHSCNINFARTAHRYPPTGAVLVKTRHA